jgi:Peptidase family M1 domain
LQNANEVGFGYEAAGVKIKPPVGNTITWKFSGQNIHDFVWAADPSYKLVKRQIANGPLIYVVYKKIDSLEAVWKAFADTMELAYPYMAKTFGEYPYKNYTFIQGGDGGMEYPMATLIKNAGIGTGLHEWMHSWYQGMLGTNESLYPWMDEGFTSYAESRVAGWLHRDTAFVFNNDYRSYNYLVKSGREEPLSTHADHYATNMAYGAAAYGKGAVFLAQLGYIVGDSLLDKILLDYYMQWRFKHPNPNDFIRIAEKASRMELQWYKEYWVSTTKAVDYAVGDINIVDGKTYVTLKRIGLMPMPIDVLVTYKDGSKELHYIPLDLMFGAKAAEGSLIPYLHDEWKWVNLEYQLPVNHGIKDIKEIEIDPSKRLADVNRNNNRLVVPD